MFVEAHGIKTQYQVIGQGPILVLLHGWGCDWQIWYPIIQELSKEFQLIIPDLPAFGQSANPNRVWITEDYTSWLSDFLNVVIKTKSFTLVGHSFGGKISVLYASQKKLPQPQKLIIIDSAGIPDILSSNKKLQQRLLGFIPEPLKDAVPSQLKRYLLRLSGSAEDHFNSTPTQRQILRKTIRENLSNELPNIKIPTLLIWGAKDVDTPIHHAYQFHKGIKASKLEILASSGHFPFIDDPTTFIKITTNFAS
jgi:pimeloyl-ACP methyl ester carboxylesterase